MSTGANLGKGDDFSQNVNPAVENTDLTVNSAHQTVSTDTPAASAAEPSFSFSDLLLYAHLSDSDKILLSGLQSQGVSSEKLARALRHMVKTPPDSSPSDKFDGVSLSDILSEPETTLKEFMRKPELSPSNHAILLQLIASGASDDLVIKTGERLIQYYPTQVPAQVAPKSATPTSADTGYSLDMSVLQRDGTSRADVIAFALDEYYNDRMKKAFNGVREGEFRDGYNHYQDAQTAYWTMLEMILKANDIADKNYRASQGEAQNRFSDDSMYHRFLKDHLQIDPASLNEE